jgi:imidazolonepropionase-like amidohydrolase
VAADSRRTVIRDVRIFDGERIIEADTLLVRDGTIAEVGGHAPAGAGRVDGHGGTLLPGLIDCHVHAEPASLSQALTFGVTTELCMFADPQTVRARRELAARRDDVADIRAASYGATSAASALRQMFGDLPALSGPQDAATFVADRVAEGADYIKLYLEDPRWFGRADLSAETVRALVTAAHEHGRLAVAHADSAAMARMFVAEGGDGLAHVLGDIDPSCPPRFAVATLHATAVFSTEAAGEVDETLRELLGHPRLGPYLNPAVRRVLADPDALTPARAAVATRNAARLNFEAALRSTRALHEAGTPILAGTDVNEGGGPSPMMRALSIGGHGLALHHELGLLVRAGLTPAQALAAATSLPARHFGLADRGRIAPGLRADLLLVDGDPVTDITATRSIAGVWRRGVRLDREARRAA